MPLASLCVFYQIDSTRWCQLNFDKIYDCCPYGVRDHYRFHVIVNRMDVAFGDFTFHNVTGSDYEIELSLCDQLILVGSTSDFALVPK